MTVSGRSRERRSVGLALLRPERWCERGDSNPHPLRDQILSLARLPIPPLSRPAIIINQEGLINSRRRATKAGGASRAGRYPVSNAESKGPSVHTSAAGGLLEPSMDYLQLSSIYLARGQERQASEEFSIHNSQFIRHVQPP